MSMKKIAYLCAFFTLIPFAASALTFTRSLSLGSTGSDVTALQQFLNQKGYLSAQPTGYFGSLTEAAVEQYQSASGIVSAGTPETTGYGAVGPKTLASLNGGGVTDKAALIAALVTEVKVLEAQIAAILSSQSQGVATSTASSSVNAIIPTIQTPSTPASGGGGGGGSTVSSSDGGGGGGGGGSSGTTATLDTSAPSIPANIAASAASGSQINLSWSASSDNVSVSGYDVYRNGVLVGTSAGTTYTDTGLTASTAYTYTVAAFDAAGNTSAQSASVIAITTSSTSATIAVGGSVIATANLNVRESASPDATSLGTVQSGTFGTVIGGPTTTSGHTWWHVSFTGGLSGWCIADYLVPASSASSPALGAAPYASRS